MAISGGTYVIVQHASDLHAHGYDVTLAVQEPFGPETLAWHDEAPKLRCIPISVAKGETYDLVVATWWKTVFELQDFNSSRFAYFIQSIESRFYPESERPLRELVDATYAFPLACVTEATWIRQYLNERFGRAATLVRNGIRKDVYVPDGRCMAPRNGMRQPRVLVEGHFGVAFKNTALGIRLAKEAGARDIWVMTGSPVTWLPGAGRVFSRVPMVVTPEIYRSCDILIKLSTVEGMFGPPLEMFHCGGTAVVFDVTGHDEYIADGRNAKVVSQGDVDGVVRTLRHLLTDRDELARLKAGALATADAWPSWQQSSALFRDWVEQAAAGPKLERALLAEMTQSAFSNYARDEQRRLGEDRRIVRRHKLSAIASRLPRPILRRIKQLEAVGEVMFGGRKAF